MRPKPASALSDDRRRVLQRRVRWIAAATIGYNVINAVVAIAAGTIASPGAPIAFGLDSTLEVLAAAAVAGTPNVGELSKSLTYRSAPFPCRTGWCLGCRSTVPGPVAPSPTSGK